ncbi:Meiosis-specific protein HOP1 [Nosema bombycis CQ1]|uniref:Meiosis-specific protein HOP1 n=1 Tax=Nosema bombycis (strain CQ1 / CVCC 102059) TaxID=578461 RepID=R0MEA9_NOSB1|nr:Meiosis-specific protein HOP1 [Nosema bombycis CQ1]|eukprot:EOB12410.1 Meiosis-specific protein HOP1 [Nosema bombycis CQ1]
MQVQSQIQSLVHTTFSCIAYLRDLLDDSCFEDQKLGKSLIKKLVRNSKSKEILNLLEGMYESIKLEYLESFEIGIYRDNGYNNDGGNLKGEGDNLLLTNPSLPPSQPTPHPLLESYSFEINYNQNESNPESTIKSFCLYLQKLKPLPPSKYVTLKLYYNEKVPLNYNPKGFKDGGYHNFIYKNKKIKIEGEGNGVTLKEIYVEEENEEVKEVGDGAIQPILSQPSQPSQRILNQPSQVIPSQPSQVFPSQPSQPTPTHPTPTQPSLNTQPTPNTPSLNPTTNNNDPISCLCGDPSDTFDLIQCDYCNYWLHTVCCGFYSNTDKRIPKGKYQCYKCKKDEYDINVIYFRKSLSILYNEGFKSYSFFNKRMNVKGDDAKNLILKLEEEGFLKKYGKNVYVVKNDKIKKKIKEYV